MDQSELRRLFEQALEAGRGRNYPEAVRLLQELLVHTDQLPEALLYLGRGYHALRDFPRAVQALLLFLNSAPSSAAGHFFAGRSYFALGMLANAIHHLRRSVELEPSFPPALGLLGLAALKSGKVKISVGFFEQALKLDPDNPQLFNGYLNALLTLAIRLFARRQHEEARDLLLFIQKHRPSSLVVHLYLAGIYRELGEAELALRQWEQASRLAPQDPVIHLQKAAMHLQRGASREALAALEVAARYLGGETAPTSDPRELARLIMMVLFGNRRYHEALECARRLLRVSYTDAKTHAVMAECFARLGDQEKATNHYLRAIEREPERLEYRYGLASVLWERGAYGELAEQAHRIMHHDPDDPYAAYYLALSLPFLGENFEATIPALQEQIRRHGPDPHLMHALGKEYLRANLPDLAEGWFRRTLQRMENHEQALRALIEVEQRLERPEQTLSAYEQYLSHYPRNSGVRRQYARLLYRQKKYAAAASQIEQLFPRGPKSAALRRLLAVSYQRCRRYAEAVLLWRDLLRENPSSEELLRSLVACLDRSGSRPTAIALVRKASQVFPDRPAIHELLGVLYMRDDEPERATEALRRAVSLFPQDWRTQRALGLAYRRMNNTLFAEKYLSRAQRLRGQQKGRLSPARKPRKKPLGL